MQIRPSCALVNDLKYGIAKIMSHGKSAKRNLIYFLTFAKIPFRKVRLFTKNKNYRLRDTISLYVASHNYFAAGGLIEFVNFAK